MLNNNISEKENGDFIAINPLTIVKTLYKNKFKILFITIAFAVFSVFYALGIKNEYRSYSILFPNTESSALSSLSRQYSGLASIAGIDLGGSASSLTAPELAEEQLKSLTFFKKYIYEDLLVDLMAGEEWDRKENLLTINNEIYDSDKNKWTRDVKWPLENKPTAQEAHYKFLTHVTSELEKSGKLTVFVKHIRPDTAKEWLDHIIQSFQADNKQRNISVAKQSINFLEQEYKNTEIKELQRIISNLLADSIQRLSVSSIEGENLFLVIQEPFSPLIKIGPNRAMICILITIFGFILSSSVFIIINIYRENDFNFNKLIKFLDD